MMDHGLVWALLFATIVMALMVPKRAVAQSLKSIAPDDLDTPPPFVRLLVRAIAAPIWSQLPMTRPPSMLTAWPVM